MTILGIIHSPIFYLKHYVSEIWSSLRNVAFKKKDRTMGNVQNCDEQFLYKPCGEGKDKRTISFLELGQITCLINEVNWERYEVYLQIVLTSLQMAN
jgi:hypothetical protein